MAMGVGGAAAETAAKVMKNKGVFESLANTAKNVGRDVISGMRGSTKTFTKQYGERILKSNMTKDQIKEMGERGAREFIKGNAAGQIKAAFGDKGVKYTDKRVINAAANVTKKFGEQNLGKIMESGAWGSGVADKMIGHQLSKISSSYKIGDAIGGGFRDTYRSMKAGHNIKDALSAGFTKKVGGEWVNIGNGMKQKVGGKSQIRMDRVVGAAFGVSVAGRVATGGGLYRDRYGRVNVPGVPFI